MQNRENALLILGGGRSGEGAKELCTARNIPYTVFEDTRSTDISALAAAVSAGVAAAVLSPGIPDDDPMLQYLFRMNLPVLSELEFGAAALGVPVIAVTGTNGKTTTSELLARMFSDAGYRSYAAGNTGLALSHVAAELFRLRADGADALTQGRPPVVVAEVSSFQLMHIYDFAPRIACVLNITPDHLDRHGSMANYAAAKARIFENQDRRDYCILNADDYECRKLKPRSKTFFVSLEREADGAYLKDGAVYLAGEFLIESGEIAVPGRHNLQNAMFAGLAAFLSGLSVRSISETLRSFQGVRHRLQTVMTDAAGNRFINDSKGTNIGAALTAARAIELPVVMVVGGSDKGYEFDELFAGLPANIKTVVTTGETEGKLLTAAKRQGFERVTAGHTFRAAVLAAYRETVKSPEPTALLLSPATASYDEFKNYEERGDAFCALIAELTDKGRQ